MPSSASSTFAWLQGGGAVGALMRVTDWAQTPLGPVTDWPQSLRSAVSICLGSRFPIVILWGPQYVALYNDGYAPMLGAKHPWAVGRPLREVWGEIWDVIGPMLDGVRRTGEATWSDDQLLILERNGFPEECYFSYSFGPARIEDGSVGGIFTAVIETTRRVVGERRLLLLKDLAERTANAANAAEACRRAVSAIAGAPQDLPFALVYLFDADGAGHLVARTPSADALPVPPQITSADDALPRGVPALAVPIAAAGSELPMGVLIAGLNARRPLDDSYRSFLTLIAGQIAGAVTDARAAEAEHARAEALAELDRAKTAFFSNVSHEFRTPLSLILGPLEEALAETSAPTEARTRLELIHRNAVRLLKLVNTLLDFSRIEAGRIEARYRPTDLAQVTTDLASLFRSAVEKAGLRFVVRCDPLPRPVYVDRAMWEKVVLNLLSNAFKYTLEGEIAVTLADAGETVRLTVRDTGAGIPADALPHIFERFRRVEGTAGRAQEGSGIGLTLVEELVKLHGGTVSAASIVGRGTTFTVTVPYGQAHLPAAQVEGETEPVTGTAAAQAFVDEARRWSDSEPAAAGAGRGEPVGGALAAHDTIAGAHVLVADDNGDMRDYLARLLGVRYSVELVSDGLRAAEAARERPPDLVIADVMMPGLDGFALLRELRADARTAPVPVILISARAGEESRLDGLARGADDYIVKPFSARDLLARVEIQLLRVQLRAAAEAERRRLFDIFHHAPAAIAIVRGPGHVFEYANPAFAALVGNRALVGRSVLEALPELREQRVTKLLDRVYATGEAHRESSRRMLIVRREGDPPQEAYFDFVYQPVRGPAGGVEGIVAIAFDVTGLAEAKRGAEAANRAKDEFLAMLGHELRNPLAPIVTALQLMTLRGDEAARKERAVIERQVRHLVRLVDDLLDVSRITRGKVTLRREPIEISEIVARGIEMASPLLEERHHRLSVDVPRSGLAVAGDATRLAQVITNLLSNSAKYTEPRGEIVVRAARVDGRAELRVADTGVGISPDMLPRVFDLFAQESQTFERSRGGLGLGLTIVRSLVEMHGGTIEAHSDGLGRGSQFVVRLPALDPGAVHQAPPAADLERQQAADPLRVLVVDDNRDAAEMLAEALALAGHTPRVAVDATVAMALAREFRPQVALVDLGLPVMDGYELAARIRADSADRLPVLVAVTGYGQDADRRRSEAAGFRTHLVKPVDLESLERLVEQIGREVRGL